MLKSPHNISYDDLIEATHKRLAWMESSYPKKVLSKELNEWTATHNIAAQKALLKLLRKFKREPQTNLFDAFQTMRK